MAVPHSILRSVVLSALFFALPARAETLIEAINATLKTNPDVLIEVARRHSVDEAVKQAYSGYYPKVDLSAGTGRERLDNPTTTATYGGPISQKRTDKLLTLSQMLFDGFGVSSEVDRNIARQESAAHKVAGVSEQTALKAVEAYLEVLRQAEIIELTKQNTLVHERTLDQIRLRAQSGVGRKSDLDQIEARLALSRANLTATEANLKVAEINYKLVVGNMPKSLVKPVPPDAGLLPRNAEDAVEQALFLHRLLKSARADVEAANAQHRSARSFLYPRLDLEVGNNRMDTQSSRDSIENDAKSVMLRLRFNLFKGGSDMARIGETKQQVYEAAEAMQRTERQIEQSIRLSWNAYTSARDRLPNLQKHAESSLLTREAYSKQFALGQRTLLDLLDTENEYYMANVNFVNGQYVEFLGRFRLLADLNQLVEMVGAKELNAANHRVNAN